MVNNFQFVSASVSDRGLSEKRPQNEDSFLELPEQGIFAVADGVGGAQAGDVASQMAMEILAEAFMNKAEDDAEEILRLAITRANTAIHQMSHDLPQLNSMATTIVALHLNGNIATIAHVGDSRLYRLDSNARLLRETDDHSVVEEEVRAGRMTPEQAANHPSRNVISRALGAEETVDIDLKTIMFDAGSAFLLCSDGITRHVDDAEINQLLASDAEPASICDSLKELCYSRGAEDNLTAVIVKIPADASVAAEPNTSYDDTLANTPETTDIEEVTLASARSPFDSVVEQDNAAVNADDPASAAEDYSSSSMTIPAQDETVRDPEPTFVSNTEEKQGSSVFGKALAGLALLLLGVLIGYAAGMLFQKPPAETIEDMPVITEVKTVEEDNTPFERGRRIVDNDPAAYAASRAASTPETPEDYFLLGRAYMLSGKNWEAKKAFEEARNRFAQADPKNAKVMAFETAMALSIINSGPASQSFTNEITAINEKAAADGANANTSSAAPNANSTAPVPAADTNSAADSVQ